MFKEDVCDIQLIRLQMCEKPKEKPSAFARVFKQRVVFVVICRVFE